VPVLALGVVEEAEEERVGGVLRTHHEAHPLGTHVQSYTGKTPRQAAAAAPVRHRQRRSG
jgi:hypothetical protein